MKRDIKTELNEYGFVLMDDLLAESLVAEVLKISPSFDSEGTRPRGGFRMAEEHFNVTTILQTTPVMQLLEDVMPGAVPVRCILFDKTPEANWKVPWHQDLTICVEQRADAPGFHAWSIKEGVNHVQPPAEILAKMVTLRLHLDDCGPENGPLQVLPGSHKSGRLSAEQIEHRKSLTAPVHCCTRKGGALIMKPLLLHASSTASNPGHRRVLHLELANFNLPHDLRWHGGLR